MVKFSLFHRRGRPQYFIAVDIGSNTAIRSLLFRICAHNATALKRREFELPVRGEEQELIPPTFEYLRNVFLEHIRELGQTPSSILVGLGNHFTFNEMTTVVHRRDHPLSPLQVNEFPAILRTFVDEHRAKTIDRRPYLLAHVMPFQISVDGYALESLAPDTRGQIIEITLFATYAEERFWLTISELRSVHGGLDIRFISNQAAIASALVSVLGIHDALTIKIGAKITEVSLLADDAIRFTGQFDKGGDDVTRTIAERLNIPRRDAERMKRQWETMLPVKTARTTLEDAVRAPVAGWVETLVELLKSEERFVLPERVMLLGGGARLGAIREVLMSASWFDQLTFLERLDIELLRAETLAAGLFGNSELPLSGPEDVALASLAIRASQKQRP